MNRGIILMGLALALIVSGRAGARAVVAMGCHELIETLLFDPVKDRREDTAEGLGSKGCEAGISALIDTAFHDPSREVRTTAVWALEDLDTPAARGGLLRLVESAGAGGAARLEAFRALAKLDPARLDESLGPAMVDYRQHAPALGLALVERVGAQERTELGDTMVFVALDRTVEARVRLAALGAAERLEHPRSYEAHLALLDSSDRGVRARCLEGLARVGGPSSELGPVLERIAASDPSGELRGKAMAALALHAHPGLLETVHRALVHEKN
ncbi:MAG: HEAT repeat domain-containing protein, partial [Myxococcota bacterium]|nr:HEAT repeat domain-containing protein [Myxococcota bacterium]